MLNPSALPTFRPLWIFGFSFIHPPLFDFSMSSLCFYHQSKTHTQKTLNPHRYLFPASKEPGRPSARGLQDRGAFRRGCASPGCPRGSPFASSRSSRKRYLPVEVVAGQPFYNNKLTLCRVSIYLSRVIFTHSPYAN